MFNKITSIAAATSFALISTAALAADTVQHDIMLSATIPTTNFVISPVNADTVNKTHSLAYNVASSTFAPYIASFTVKSTSAVKAKLFDTGSDKLYNGVTPMNLAVKFNGFGLSTTSTEVVAAAQASIGNNFQLSIAPTGVLPVAGTYTGTVSVVFDNTL